MIAVPTATFCGPAYPPDAEHMAKYLESGEYDEAVVERFNELVKEKKIESPMTGDGWVIFDDRVRLRPAPRYRPFTAVEAAAHIGMSIHRKDDNSTKWCNWSITGDEVWAYSINMDMLCFSPEQAAEQLVFTDSGEPFGVKEE